jgi:hypothetical protein
MSAAAVLALTSSSAHAQITHLETVMDGASEVPPVVTNGTGRADYVLNTFTHTLKFNVSFQNLTSAENNAHIHVTSSTAILFPLPLGSPIFGSLTTSPGQEATILLPNGTYTNIHTTMHPGGEIRGTNVLSPVVGTKLCFGDGTSGPCPCGNNGAAGHGCENSISTGGSVLEATGHVSPDNVVLIATGERATALSIFLQGNAMLSPAVVFGDGLRCTGGQLKRLSTKSAAGGAIAYPEGAEQSITVRAAALGQPNNPGDTRWYQTYYRDPDPVFCPNPPGNTFNISNAVQITW